MPLFVTFEGPDGSGKSTQARLLVEALRAEGHAVVETREPGGTQLGEAVRALALDAGSPDATPLALALLMSASRAQLLSEVILPALARGEVVVCDRFADSTMAYQAYGLGLDPVVVRDLTAIATDGVQPDVTVLVDVPVEVGLGRTEARGARNRLDGATLRFHERVREGYARLLEAEPSRWVRVDGTLPIDIIHEEIMEALIPRLERIA